MGSYGSVGGESVMKEKTKIVQFGDTRFQLRKLPPGVGTFIAMQLLGAGIKAGNLGGGDPQSSSTEAAAPQSMATGEELVRAVAFSAFLRGLEYEAHQFVQTHCLAVCSRMEQSGETEVPMPIVNDSGQWAIPEVRDDMSLVMKLELEVLVFNLSDFFAEGGLNALVGKQASTA